MKKILSVILSLAMLLGLLGAVSATAEDAAPVKAEAYIMYANSDWSVQYWNNDGEETAVVPTNAEITGDGAYTVGLDFTKAAPDGVDVAFTALGVKGAIENYPGLTLNITGIRINGEAVEFQKGYTNDEDGRTRMNIYNEWVSAVPKDGRVTEGDLTSVTAQMVSKDKFTGVKTMEVDFTAETMKAYVAFASADWAVSYWGGEAADPVAAVCQDIKGEGTYTASVTLKEPIADIAFAGLMIKNGNKVYPGYFMDVKEVKINGEAVELGKGYTSSDDGTEMRSNLYNEWVGETLPKDARRADGNLEGATATPVAKEAFANMQSLEVTFDFIYGEPPVEESDTMTEEEAKAAKEAGFHAYIGVQGTDTYVFRNAWNDNYGMNDTENPFFGRLTGWDADNKAVDYGGTFTDAEIKEDGEVTVSLTTGDMGFGETKAFNLLFVSTDIPSKLMKGGYLTIDNVKTKIGSAAEQTAFTLDTTGDYLMIKILDTYNQSEAPFGYTVPGAGETITISFTVSGMAE